MLTRAQIRDIEHDAFFVWRASPTRSVEDIARRHFGKVAGHVLPPVPENAKQHDQALYFQVLQTVAGARVAWMESQGGAKTRGLRPLIRQLGNLTGGVAHG